MVVPSQDVCLFQAGISPFHVAAWRGLKSPLVRRSAIIILPLAGLAKATLWLGFLLPTDRRPRAALSYSPAIFAAST
jgi:hypothetical protein